MLCMHVVLLTTMVWLSLSILAFPSPPKVYDETISLKVYYTGNLLRWSANFDLFDYHSASSRSFDLQMANLSTDSKCHISFTIYPFMSYQERKVEVTVIEIVPQMDLEMSLTTDIDYVSARLENNEFIETILLRFTFNQPPLFERVLLPYGRVFYQTEVKSNQDIPLSKLIVTTPIALTVHELEPSREVATVRIQGSMRITKIEPQRNDEVVVIQLFREPSRLIPLALNFVSLLSVANLVYALHRSLSNREHKIVMYMLGSIAVIMLTIIIWFMYTLL